MIPARDGWKWGLIDCPAVRALQLAALMYHGGHLYGEHFPPPYFLQWLSSIPLQKVAWCSYNYVCCAGSFSFSSSRRGQEEERMCQTNLHANPAPPLQSTLKAQLSKNNIWPAMFYCHCTLLRCWLVMIKVC